MERNTRWLGLGLVVLFVFPFSIYLSTLAPTITWRNDGADGGDLITAAYTLGIAHPPGYPTFVMLGKLFTLLPFGDVAYRVNLMSAFLASVTVVLVYLITLEICALPSQGDWGERKPALLVAAGISGLALAFSPVFWSQATIAEVHALHAFFFGAILYLLVRWMRVAKATSPIAHLERARKQGEAANRHLLAAALIYGLSLGNHPSMLLLAPPALFLVAKSGLPRLRTLFLMGVLFLVGLSVYLYLPWRASQRPPLNWGDPQTCPRFLWMVSAAPYRRFAFSLPIQYLPRRLAAWAALLCRQFTWPGLFLGLLGLWYHWQQNREVALSLLFFFGLIVIYAITYNTTDSYLYLIPSFLVFSLWLGAGIYFLLAKLDSSWTTYKGRLSAILTPLSSLLLIILIPGLSLHLNYTSLDLSEDYTAYDYAQDVFATIEPNAILIADTDRHIFPLWYFRHTTQRWSDVTIIAKPLLQYGWYREHLNLGHPQMARLRDSDDVLVQLLGIIEGNLADRPIYLTDTAPQMFANYRFSRRGQLYLLEGRSSDSVNHS